MKSKILVVAFVAISALLACKKEIPTPGDPVSAYALAGENCSVNDATSYAFSHEVSGLNTQQSLDFFVGNSFFQQNWVEAPSSTTARDGLGPLFNTQSCSSCHFRDGRGKPFSGEGILFRLSVPGNNPEPIYGGQFQDHGISTAMSEGDILITYSEMAGQFADGSMYSLRVPTYNMINLNYGAMDPGTLVSPRVGGQVIGLGLLEIIPEADILQYADESDSDGDGISGRANYVHDVYNNMTMIGRFGWKANTPTLATQVAAAFNGDIGIKSTYFPTENYTANQPGLSGLPDGGVIEISDDDLEKVILYCRTLAVPYQRNPNYYNVRTGQQLFRELECAKCHRESFVTGTAGNIAPLKSVQIHPYTDLLLHDMGPGLADDRPDGLANGSEWRTPPLWGIGLIETVNGHSYLLHDGRARTIEEAILWHGGEAENSKEAYKALDVRQRQYVLDFLNSL